MEVGELPDVNARAYLLVCASYAPADRYKILEIGIRISLFEDEYSRTDYIELAAVESAATAVINRLREQLHAITG